MTSKTIFKQVDFWLQFLVIFVIPIFYYLRIFNFFIFDLVYAIATVQILSAIANFLIYKSERSTQRKKYELFTTAFIIFLIVQTIFFELINSAEQDPGFNFIPHLGLFYAQLWLSLISPFLAFWYLGITFGEFKALNLKKWW